MLHRASAAVAGSLREGLGSSSGCGGLQAQRGTLGHGKAHIQREPRRDLVMQPRARDAGRGGRAPREEWAPACGGRAPHVSLPVRVSCVLISLSLLLTPSAWEGDPQHEIQSLLVFAACVPSLLLHSFFCRFCSFGGRILDFVHKACCF